MLQWKAPEQLDGPSKEVLCRVNMMLVCTSGPRCIIQLKRFVPLVLLDFFCIHQHCQNMQVCVLYSMYRGEH